MPDKTITVAITGRVQGVGFRMWTEGEARTLGLRGWVRNEPDGSVSALISGSEEAVAKMVDLLHSGPPGARVDTVETRPATSVEVPPDFRQRR